MKTHETGEINLPNEETEARIKAFMSKKAIDLEGFIDGLDDVEN